MNKIFLLGGYDLEMVTIKELLEKYSMEYKDKKLSWGAKLSDYEEFFDDNHLFIGVELEQDRQPPKHYMEIDHHGHKSDQPSALEQVAALLDVELDRWQQLVAANDAHYIAGMQKFCATYEEIQKIRHADRQAQGVSQKDEELGVESIKKSNNHIVYALTPHFSAITDRIYDKYTHYIIYNDEKIVFYGYKVKKVLEFLKQNNIQPSHCYFGGGAFGFVGIKEDVLSKDEIKHLVKEFDGMSDEVISYHTFMFPFVFKGAFDKKDMWEYHQFEIQQPRDYNEYVYFYKHVQDALYNVKGEMKHNFISKYYEYKEQEGTYTITTKNKGSFILKLDGISLRIFNTNIAILSFNLINDTYYNPQDILAINDFGRRIYPQFLGENFTQNTKEAFLAQSISLKFSQKKICEDFTHFNKIENLSIEKFNFLPKFIHELISPNFTNFTKIRPIIDDRMFVISQYHNDVLSHRMKNYCETTGYGYEKDDFWYKYVYVDGNGKTCQSKYMTKELIQQSTYDRWVEDGTLFGITRYSFVVLTDSGFGKGVILPHTQTMYFQIFSLLLAYRATIIEFLDEIQNITSKSDEEIIKEAKDLYKRYLNFLNKLYFKEVTAQDQGIELYNKAMQIMDIPKYMADLDNEINELHSYIEILEEKKIAKTMNKLTWIGGVLLPPSLVAGYFGMNTLGSWEFESGGISLIWIIASGFIIPILFAIFEFLQKEHHE